jgi:hypothetical protein
MRQAESLIWTNLDKQIPSVFAAGARSAVLISFGSAGPFRAKTDHTGAPPRIMPLPSGVHLKPDTHFLKCHYLCPTRIQTEFQMRNRKAQRGQLVSDHPQPFFPSCRPWKADFVHKLYIACHLKLIHFATYQCCYPEHLKLSDECATGVRARDTNRHLLMHFLHTKRSKAEIDKQM